jgi:hypothetical protein
MSIENLFVPNSFNIYAANFISSGIITQPRYYRIDYVSTGSQTIPNTTLTPVNFTSNLISSNFVAPTTNNTYTAPIAGLYNISYQIAISASGGTGQYVSYIKKSSASLGYAIQSTSNFEASALTVGPPVSAITLGTDTISISSAAVVPLNLGETFQILVTQNTGASQTLVTSGALSQLISINLISPF